MKILLVKTSSLGDVVHALAAVTDAHRHQPAVTFTWVLEEEFEPIARLHPAVEEVIPVAIRRWRRSMMRSGGEVSSFLTRLRDTEYDVIVDAQGLLKSALVSRSARCAQGARHGFDRASARESVASLFYDVCHAVPTGLHAVRRQKLLLAQSLGYEADPMIDYGMPVDTSLRQNRIMLLHGTSWRSKEWPEPYWRQLAELLVAMNYSLLLVGGDERECQRASRIGEGLPATILKRPGLGHLVEEMRCCAAVVCVDTGLGHLAAALGLPVTSIFGATDPQLTGVSGTDARLLVSNHLPCMPCKNKACRLPKPDSSGTIDANAGDANAGAGDSSSLYPPCYLPITPESVWQTLQSQITPVSSEQC